MTSFAHRARRSSDTLAGREAVRGLLTLAVGIGILGAGVQLALLAAKQVILHRFIGYSWMLVWMTPLVSTLLSLVPVLMIAAISAWRPVGRRTIAWGMTAILSLAIMAPLALFSQLHLAAVVVLAVGTATQCTRFLLGHWDVSRRVMRTAVPVLLALPVVGVAVVHGRWWLAERRAIGALSAAGVGSPNVLLIILDTVRARSLGLFGIGRNTSPNINAVAADGVRFRRAFSTAPWTLPTHQSLMTGRFAQELDGGQLRRPRTEYPTLAAALARSGYLTAGFVGNVLYTARESGIPRGFAHFDAYQVTWQDVLRSSGLILRLSREPWIRRATGKYTELGRRPGKSVTDHFVSWLARSGGRERPFFAFLNYFDAHAPYLPTREAAARLGVGWRKDPFLVSQDNVTDVPPDVIDRERDAYEAGVAQLDAEIGRMLALVDSLGYGSNTLVIVTSDHGEGFMEHGALGHGHSLYATETRIPLVMRFPGRIPAGLTVEQAVTLADVPATILDLVGVTAPEIPGSSLTGTWDGTGGGRPAISALREQRSVGVADFRLLLNVLGRPVQLFDRLADPLEQRDLSADPAYADVMRCLEGLLDDPRPAAGARCLDIVRSLPNH